MSGTIAHSGNDTQAISDASLKEDLRSGTALQPPAPPRTVMDYIKGTLRYIGKNPIQFAFSVGVGMAVSFGVKAGLIAMGLGLGPMGLAIGAAMLTSVILNVGRKLWKGEQIKLEDLAGKSLFSGIFAGIIGGIFGTGMSDQLNEAFRDVPSADGAPLPAEVVAPDPNLRPNLTATDSPLRSQDAVLFNSSNLPDRYAYVEPDRYAYVENNENWLLTERYLGSNNLDYISVKAEASHTVDQLLETNKDYYAFLGTNGSVTTLMSKEQLEYLSCKIENAHDVAGIPQPEEIIIKNDPRVYAGLVSTTFDAERGHYIHLNTGLLTNSKEAVEYTVNHEVRHGAEIFERPLDYHLEDRLHPSSYTEHSADASALKDGNYKGALDLFSDIAYIEQSQFSDIIERLEAASSDKLNLQNMLESIKQFQIDIDKSILQSGGVKEIRQELVEKMKTMSVLDITIPGDTHPAIRDRMLEVMKHAAVDENLKQEPFEAQLAAAQAKLNDVPELINKINLGDEWCKIRESAVQGQDVGIAAKEVTRNYSLAVSGDPLLEQLGHMNTHASPITHVERLSARRTTQHDTGRSY